ncbi:hypothetical protein [Cohnella ginsengisoli]|uniref:hypothetical protein n=1 Tax=Cohnella ginsengisoli TaxID=425004 RepID=UPI0030B8B9E1
MAERLHILVAEDDDDINRLLCSVLRSSGHEPQPAYSGTEAELYLGTREWAMVLLDLMLPGKRGGSAPGGDRRTIRLSGHRHLRQKRAAFENFGA